eukprot:jgi/Tetstr1/437971/TSEL_026601.t1
MSVTANKDLERFNIGGEDAAYVIARLGCLSPQPKGHQCARCKTFYRVICAGGTDDGHCSNDWLSVVLHRPSRLG